MAEVLPKVSNGSQNYHRVRNLSYVVTIDSKMLAKDSIHWQEEVDMTSSPVCMCWEATSLARVSGRR